MTIHRGNGTGGHVQHSMFEVFLKLKSESLASEFNVCWEHKDSTAKLYETSPPLIGSYNGNSLRLFFRKQR